MALEIERKFLVRDTSYRALASSARYIQQAYLNRDPAATVRLRISGDDAWLTVKGLNTGAVRHEWEYPVPADQAAEMMQVCAVGPVLTKTRWIVGRWEIDEYHGALEGLTVAEIELSGEYEHFDRPDFIGREVTGDPRYYNSVLSSSTELPPVE